MAATITADSVPVYGIFTSNVWGCYEWMEWHKQMVIKYGLDEANARWITKWQDQSFWSTNYSFCKYQSDFANYFRSVGLADETGDILSKLVVASQNIVTNSTDTAENLTKFLKYAIPITAGVVVCGLIYFGIRLLNNKSK